MSDNHFKNISNECKDLISRMLNPDPDARITLDQVFKHTWVINKDISKTNLGKNRH